MQDQVSRYTGSWQFAGCKRSWRLVTCAVLLLAMVSFALPLLAAQPDTANTKSANERLKIAVHVSSDANCCYAPGLVAAIKYFTSKLADEVNRDGGIANRQIELSYHDDFEDACKTVSNVRAANADPAT